VHLSLEEDQDELEQTLYVFKRPRSLISCKLKVDDHLTERIRNVHGSARKKEVESTHVARPPSHMGGYEAMKRN
jgi:hypothetical protein